MADYRIIDRGGTRDILGEGLLWSRRDNAVYWTDISSPALNRLSLAHGHIDRWTMPDMIGWVIERQNAPGFIAGFRKGFAELRLAPLEVVAICDPEPDLPQNRLNDAVADKWGRIWAGTMPLSCDRPEGSLYRLDPDHSLIKMDSGYCVANGPAISPCQQWLYHSDTPARIIYRFELHEDGSLDGKQRFIRFPDRWGMPDGMTCDAEGHLWVAHWGGSRVSCFRPDGSLDRKIDLPASQITNVCFAGENLDRMFVTSASQDMEKEPNAGCLFEVHSGATGVEPGMFGG